MSKVSQILRAVERGDSAAAEKLLPAVYDQLRTLAAARLASESAGQTLQPTALVHEAYIRLVESDQEKLWDSRPHSFLRPPKRRATPTKGRTITLTRV